RLIRAGLIQEASDRLYQLKALYPEQDDIAFLETWLLLWTGHLSRAQAKIEQAVRSYPDNRLGWLLKGQCAMLACRYEQAIEAFRNAISDDQEPGRRLLLADALRMAGQTEQSAEVLSGLLDQPTVAWQALDRLEWIFKDEPDHPRLAEAYQMLGNLYTDRPRWLNRLAGYALSRRDYARAKGLFGKAIQIMEDSPAKARLLAQPDYIAALEGYLEACILGKETSSLKAMLDRVPQQGTLRLPARFLCWRARARAAIGDQAGAMEDAARAIESASVDPELLGMVLQALQQALGRAAIEARIEALGADKPVYWAAKAHLALMDDMYEQALAAIDHLMGFYQGPDLQLSQFRGQVLILAYEHTADNRLLSEAIALYEALACEDPKYSGVLNNLAYLLAQSPQGADRALDYAKRALELSPESPAVMDTYGYALYRGGHLQEALEWLMASSGQFQVNCQDVPADVYEHIGMVHQALGQKGKALEAYRKALDAAGDNAGAKARIQKAIEDLGPQ
ncbi:MAG: tetratricopeptide repeat protein, partial [Sedimentisphaerales bacterium]|nr:tetratricopeptide repeat protein [Sedimentisphaerales bacterium]